MPNASCSSKEYAQMKADYKVMRALLNTIRQNKGKVPPLLDKAFLVLDEAFRAGENFDAAFKSACMEMGNFLATNEEYCARYIGFGSYDVFKSKGTSADDIDSFDVCMAKNYYRTTQAEAVKKILNISDQKSFITVFTQRTKEQLWGIIMRWVGDVFKSSSKKK